VTATSQVSALALLLALAVVTIGPARVWAGEPETSAVPLLTIEEAIDAAKRCVLERKIRVVGSFIESARFDRNAGVDRGPVWRVTWAYAREVKGGQVYVTVLGDGTCEVTFGE
jgi:hypothetical protein